MAQPARPPVTAPAIAPVLLAALLALPAAATRAQEGITIYRCTGSDGSVADGNTPCADGQREQQRVMQRPRDAEPRSTPPVSAPPDASPATPRAVRVVQVRPPQPMYACTTPEGESYVSDEDRSTPRWVPLWVAGRVPPPRPGWGPPRPVPRPGPGRPPHSTPVAATGVWVQDQCERLPQEAVCQHLSDRRYEILRTYHAAMPSEREALDAEQATLDARLADDCP